MKQLNCAFIEKLKSATNVEKILLFGSRATGNHRERSDIDLAVWCPKASMADWNAIMDIVEDADTLLKIDCIRLDSLSQNNPLRMEIESNGQIIYIRE